MIFYFSGTGNTRWVAGEIAKAIGEELLSIPDLIREGRYEFKLGKDAIAMGTGSCGTAQVPVPTTTVALQAGENIFLVHEGNFPN